MRYTIEGFSQTKAQEKGLDCIDLLILRWFVDFSPVAKKDVIDGREYSLISYQKILDDLPLLGIGRRAVASRISKLASANILNPRMTNEFKGKKGTFTVCAYGPEYGEMVGGCCSNDRGGAIQTAPEDESIRNKSTKDKIDRIDKNALRKRALRTIDPLTEFLVEKNAISGSDPYLEEFDRRIRELIQEHGYEVVRSAVYRAAAECRTRDDQGKPIENRACYVRASIENGCRLLTKINMRTSIFEEMEREERGKR